MSIFFGISTISESGTSESRSYSTHSNISLSVISFFEFGFFPR
ncbi:MAG: hypothetical protein ACYCSG_03970 [Thermoplasmataceae archaeon]